MPARNGSGSIDLPIDLVQYVLGLSPSVVHICQVGQNKYGCSVEPGYSVVCSRWQQEAPRYS